MNMAASVTMIGLDTGDRDEDAVEQAGEGPDGEDGEDDERVVDLPAEKVAASTLARLMIEPIERSNPPATTTNVNPIAGPHRAQAHR